MNIKTGDLVMVVKPAPCCGYSGNLGLVFTVARTLSAIGDCCLCGKSTAIPVDIVKSPGDFMLASTLKKIDPPADGDSLPTRKDSEVAA